MENRTSFSPRAGWVRIAFVVVALAAVGSARPICAACPDFAAPVNYGAGATPFAVAIGDVNGDGKPDLAVANASSSNVSILLGNGDGTFAAPVNYGVGTNPLSVAIGDVTAMASPTSPSRTASPTTSRSC